jgi:hypothetical protein
VTEALLSARELVSLKDFCQPPIDICRIAHSLGVCRVESREMTADGYLGKQEDGGFVIRYRIGNSERRNRFTIAHEVGHLLLSRVQGKVIAAPTKRGQSGNWEERAVNRIAAELLVPETYFQGELLRHTREGKAPSWAFVRELARLFQVSEDAIVFRLLEMPQLVSVLFRVGVNGTGPRFPYSQSENASFRLARNADYELDRLWREARRSNRHRVPIVSPNGCEELFCEGRMRSVTTGRAESQQYWVIGWTVMDDSRLTTSVQQMPLLLDAQ